MGGKIGQNVCPIIVKSSAGFEALVSTMYSLCVVLRLQTDCESWSELESCEIARMDHLWLEGFNLKFGDSIK